MKPRMLLLLGISLLMVGSVGANVYYLHADMPLGSTPLDDTLWFTEPVGGIDKATDGGTFGGNQFDLNGYILRTPNTSGISSFSGTIMIGTAGAGLAELLAGGWNLTGLDVDNAFQMRLRRSTVDLTVSDMVIGSAGNLNFRTLTANNNLNLSIADISGSGLLGFGDNTYANDVNGVWTLDITAGTFSGTVGLNRGQLIFGSSFALNEAAFTIDSGEVNSVVLSNSVSFGSVSFGAAALANGTYTATELNAEFSTTIFSGPGSMTVPELPPEDNFWLHADMEIGSSPLDETLWFDDPVAGTDMATLGSTVTSNRFNLNGYILRSPNSTGTSSFYGTIVVGAEGADLAELHTSQWNLGRDIWPYGMDIRNNLLMRLRRASVGLHVEGLYIGTGGDLGFRTLTGNNNLILAVSGLTGSGEISFGLIDYANDINGVWAFSIDEGVSDFSGTLQLTAGQLVLSNDLELASAILTIDDSLGATVSLNSDVVFSNVSYGASTPLAAGLYSATDLNAAFSASVFTGSGSVQVGSLSAGAHYSTWLEDYSLTGSNTNMATDVEPDGMDNLVEYALGGNPTNDDTVAILPVSSVADDSGTNWLYYIYNRRDDAVARGLAYTVVSDTDLIYGTMTNVVSEYGVSAAVNGFESVTNRIPTDTDGKGFMKLNIGFSE